MATVKQYTKKDGTKAWQFQVYLGKDETTGKEIRTTRRGFRTQAEAKQEINKLLVDYQKNGLRKNKRILFQNIYNDWFEQYERTVKESTAYATKKLFKNHGLPSFKNLYIDKITLRYCQKQVNIWSGKIIQYDVLISYMIKIFDYAIKLGYREDNPMKHITKPRKKQKSVIDLDQQEDDFYTKEELQQFLEYAKNTEKPRYYPLFRLLAFSGMRVGEALALIWNDIDFENHIIKITKTVANDKNGKASISTPKTRNSTRSILIDEITLSILYEWKETQKILLQYNDILLLNDAKQLIFPNQSNKATTTATIWYAVNRVMKRNNLRILTTHGLRHTHCSLLFEAGATIKEVQDRLGHTDIKTTMDIYTHVTKNQKKETVNKFIKLVDF